MNPSGSVANRLREKLETAFAPQTLAIEDESARHSGHSGAREGGESHFRVRIVSAAFNGLTRVERQRRVYAVVADEIEAGLHALALTTLTPEEAQRS
ncbi:MAG TPA: BolA family protein [Micropepsaceae bacterium]|nr:BolA family protein [Micropepsaceae bacterium]